MPFASIRSVVPGTIRVPCPALQSEIRSLAKPRRPAGAVIIQTSTVLMNEVPTRTASVVRSRTAWKIAPAGSTSADLGSTSGFSNTAGMNSFEPSEVLSILEVMGLLLNAKKRIGKATIPATTEGRTVYLVKPAKKFSSKAW